MDISQRNPNEASSPPLLCSSQKLSYSQKASKGQSTLLFSKTTDNGSPHSCAVTLQTTLLLQSPQTGAKSISVPTSMLQTSSAGLRKVTVSRALLTTMSFFCQLDTRGTFPAQVLTFLFSAPDACSEVNRLLMSQHSLQPFQTLLSLG